MNYENINSKFVLMIALLFYISSVSAEVLNKGELPNFATSNDMATLYIYRPWAFVGGGGDYDLYLNDEFIGNADNGSVVFTRAKPGIYDLWIKLTEGVQYIFHADLVVNEGEIYFVLLFGDEGELGKIVDQDTGKKAILDILK